MKHISRSLVRPGTTVLVGVVLELAISLLLDSWHDPGAPAALGVLVAVLAGALEGWWAGLLVGAVGWALNFALVADGSLHALLGAPAWLLAGAVAGWLASRLRTREREGALLAGEIAAIREAASEAIVGLDANGTIVAWNPGAEAMYGHPSHETEGRPLTFLLGEDAETIVDAVGRGERIERREAVHRRADGEELSVSLGVVPIRNAAGQTDGAVVVATDIGESVRERQRSQGSEARYRALTENLPAVTYVHEVGNRGAWLYVSPQIEALLGYSPEEWLGEGGLFSRLLHSEDRERVDAELAAGDGSKPLRTEYRLLSRDGRVVWIRDTAVTVRDASGRALYVQGFLIDVGERRRAEEERERLRAGEQTALADARERQRKLDFLARASALLASSLDYDLTLRRVAQLTVRDLADWCVVDLIADDGSPSRLVAAHSEPGKPPGPEPGAETEPEVLDLVRRGQADVSESRIFVPLVARGRALGAITFISVRPGRSYGSDDLILARSLADRAALAIDNARLYREVEERSEAAQVLTYVGDGVFLLDRAGTIRLWNPAAENITGLAAGAVVGSPAAEAIPGWSGLVERIPVGAAGEPVQPETLPIDTGRGERWISISGVKFFGGAVYAFHDLTEAHRLDELKAEFLATASHELRTPLAAVYGAAQTLRRHDFALDEAGRERFITLIVDESDRLGRIVNEILLANQLEAGRVDLVSEPFDPVDLLERVVEMARGHAPAGVNLSVVAPEAVANVAADRDKVRQILVNLVENAVKYSPDGGSIEVGAASAEDGMVRFHVGDEGLGIPADEQARIFGKFYRLDPEMTRGVGGTGLGLYICAELVERMGGRIWVESQEGRGSTFFFDLPAAEVPSPRSIAADERERSSA